MPTVSDFLLQRLYDWGVRRIYGYPGDGINGIMGALDRAGDRLRFIQSRHEELSAFMACAHAKFSGEDEVADWWKVLEARAMNAADPINPQRVFWELSPRLPDKCILTADSGSAANWYARDLKICRGMLASLSGGLATMGPGVPYAIAAKFCHPERPVIALVGDGAMQMNGLNGLITIAKYWDEWTDPRLVVLVLNNRDLNQVTWEQRALAGDPKFEASQDIPDVGYAKFAESLGLLGIKIDHPDQIAEAWDRVLSADRPAVLEAVTDPNVPPLPPHISLEQAKAFASSVWKGDVDALGFIKQTVKDAAESILPHRK